MASGQLPPGLALKSTDGPHRQQQLTGALGDSATQQFTLTIQP